MIYNIYLSNPLRTPLELMWGIAAYMGGRHYPTDVIALIFRNYLGHCLSRPEITPPPLRGWCTITEVEF